MQKLFLMLLCTLLSLPALPLRAQDTDDDGKMLAVVTVAAAQIHQQPDTNSPLSAFTPTRPQGTRMVIIGEREGWYQVQMRTAELAWVQTADVTVEPYIPPSVLIPADAPFYVTLDTSPGFFSRVRSLYRVLNTGDDGQGIVQQTDDMLRFLFMNPDIDLDSVRQWLGDEMVVANLACQEPINTADILSDEFPDPAMAIILPIFNPDIATAFYNRQFSEGGFSQVSYQEISYGGYTYRLLAEDPQIGPPVAAIGLLDGYMVFTQGTLSMERLIDVLNGAPALENDGGFQAAFAELNTEDYFLRVYANDTVFCTLSDPLIYEALESDETVTLGEADLTDPGVFNQLIRETFQGYALGFRETGSDIALDFISSVDEARLQELTGLSDDDIAEIEASMGLQAFGFLTPELVDMLTFGTLEGTFETVSNLSTTDGEAAFESATGLNRDIFSRIEGSVTYGYVRYPVYSVDGGLEPYFLMAVQSPDEAARQATFDALTTSDNPDIQSETRDIDGVAVTVLTQGESVVEVATIGDYVLLVTNGNMSDVIKRLVTPDGAFTPNWRALVDVAVEEDETSFISGFDITSMSAESELQAAIIITPDVTPTRITVIYTLCHQGEQCSEGE